MEASSPDHAFRQPASLDDALKGLSADQALELQLVQDAMDARVDKVRADKAFTEAQARLLQFRAEQQEAA